MQKIIARHRKFQQELCYIVALVFLNPFYEKLPHYMQSPSWNMPRAGPAKWGNTNAHGHTHARHLRNLAKKSWWRSNPNTNNSSLNTYMLMLQTMIPNSQLIFMPLRGKKRVEKKSLEKLNKLVTRTNIWLLSRHNITSRNWVNEFKKLIKKLAG